MMIPDLPLHKPSIGPEEVAAVGIALRSGKLSGDGETGRRVESELRRRFECRHALLTTSCTHALELALMALEVAPGDEVICPSFTFVSCANAIARQGARPVFCDIDDETLNVHPKEVAARITPPTKAIMVVHYGGIACDMGRIRELGDAYGLAVIEDAAHAVGAKYRGRWLGTLGEAGCYSFHDTKNITCGEGGAFLTNDDHLARRAEIMREKGTDRAAFMRGEVDKYTWRLVGSSYVLSEVCAAILEAQLAKLDAITERRRQLFAAYQARLRPLAEEGLLRLPTVPPECEPNGHLFFVRLRSEEGRNRVIDGLRARGIGAAFHFVPLHSSPQGITLAAGAGVELPVTDRVSRTLVRLPIHAEMTDAQVDRVTDALRELVAA